ncbi:TraB/GumN family protein [Qipengyuania pelagi]|jgi:uncharacterized protein YbaP (TraB family)|uniref:TraB/GumN family protein n=1 Tax=Qipengyuania pelagi TaxID=994320 RepID=A0A844Y8K6_9SPHN|nr:TraB/GumN family protein [Qipengyuania pelagi]MXO53322.1 hypothetical protein [Qipengyuania pelagi]
MQLAFSVLAGLAAALLAPAAWAQDLDADVLSRHKQPAPAVTQDYEPSPAIWKLADEDTTIYLFGTFHVLPDGFRWRSAELDRVVGEADELVLETSDADGEAESQDLMVRMLSGIEKRVPTSQRLSPEAGEKWLALAKLTGTPPAVFDRMPPILAIMAVGLGQLDAMGSVRENGVETALQNEFAAAGKPIGSIENSADVFANVLAIDEDLLLAELEEDLIAWDGEDPEGFFLGEGTEADGLDLALEHRWAQGEPIDDLDFGDGEFGVLFEKVLLEDRNRAWAEWLDGRLDRPGTVLVAVGAGHFSGPKSVQVMLAERGLAAERLD